MKNIQAALEKDAPKRAWVPASNLKPCTGCGVVGDKRKPCNQCQLRGLMTKKLEGYAKATKKTNARIMGTNKQKAKKEELERRDHDYNVKFGLLKKAAVLVNSERWGDAHKTILQAVKMVKRERQEGREAHSGKERRLKQELGVPLDLELDYEALSSAPITRARLERLGIDVPVQKMEVLVERMGEKGASEFSKNLYLNEQVVQLYESIDHATKNQRRYLMSLRQRIESLEGSPEDAKSMRLKDKRLASARQMCEKVKRGGMSGG